MNKKITLLFFGLFISFASWAQTVNVQTVAVSGRFNSCSGTNTPTVTLSLVAGTGISIQNGNLTCLDPCGTTTLRVNIANVRWNQSPGSEWLHGIFFPANAGYTLSGINLPNGFITYNAGCTGTCPAGTTAGPGFYFDGTGSNACCGFVFPNDNLPCNNYGDISLNCATPFSFFFDLTFCNTLLTGASETFTLTGTSDGATGCWSTNNSIQGTISFTVNTTPCQPVISSPFTFDPVVKTCSGTTANYTVDVSGGCGNNSTINWWSDSVGGTLLGTGSPFTYDPAGSACPVGDTIYASCCAMGSTACIDRTAVVIQGVCDSMQIDAVYQASFTCNGLGRIDSTTVTNPNGAVSYTINPGNQTSPIGAFNNLAAGNYTITATDAGGCTASTSVSINPTPIVQITNINSTAASCVPGNDGSIIIFSTGGTTPYQYNIGGPNQASNTFTNLGSGVYLVTVTDVNGCTATNSVTLAPPNAPSITNVAITNVSCNGGSTGGIQVSSSGGTAPLNYNLMPGNSNNSTGNFTNLPSGSYTITISDAVNCTVSTSVTITQPTVLSWGNNSSSNVSCNGAGDGSIQLNTNGGTNPVTYLLNPGNVSSSSGNYSNLAPGTYTIVATDANNCTISTTINITQPPALVWGTSTIVNASCNGGNDGSITISATGGLGTINYNLQPGNQNNTTGNFSNLGPGNYTITATDANNCTISTLINITAPPLMQITNITANPPSCVPGNDGSIVISVSGGTPPYLYSNGGPNQSSNTFNNLGNGTYVITVTDANGCTASTTVNLLVNNPPTISSAVSNAVSCNGGTNGSLQITATNGTPPFSYNLMPGNVTNASGSFPNLPAGSYTILVTDAANCTVSTTVNVTQPNVLQFGNNVINDVSCNGAGDGNIQMNAFGGTAPYNFVLNPGNVSNTTGAFSNLAPNTYTISVTDANNCTASTTITISQPAILQWNALQATNVSCNGGNDGSISLTANGGTNPKSYNLQPGNLTNSSGTFNGLTQGTYTITITDANNCTLTSSVNITQPTQLQISNVNTTQPTCVPGNDGIITITATGGTTAYQYNIGGPNQASNTFNNLGSGSYTITVTDANNCTVTSSVTIAPPNAPSISSITTNSVNCNGGNNGSLQANSSGGTAPLSFNMMPGNITNATGTFNNLTAGTYTVTVTDAVNCSATSTAVITEPSALVWGTITTMDITCNGGNDGDIQLSASGGTGTINYLLNPGNISNTSGSFTTLTANSYTITATDANNCTITTMVVLNQPPALQWNTPQITNAGCSGGNDGAITATATGGTNPLNYTLQPGNLTDTNGSFTGLIQGTYTIIVTDGNNCTLSTTISISQPTALVISNIAIISPSCVPGNDGTITVTASGGTPAYLFNIGGPDQTSNVFNNIGVGQYPVTVTDANGCKAATLITVAPPNAPTITNVITDSVSCNGGNDGSLQITASGGVAPLSYNLMPGNVTNGSGNFMNLSAGNYTVVVSDASNCTINSILSISQPPVLLWSSATSTAVSCNGGNDGGIQVSANGGTGVITYNLNPGNTNSATGQFTNLAQGNYTITATDANNCTITTTVSITQPNPLQWNNPNTTSVSCNGGNDGSLSITSSGGTPTYSYNLTPGNITNTSGTFNNLTQGTYSVTITDANNCTLTTNITVNQPPVLQITNIATTLPSCVPGNDGVVIISALGGTQPYQYNIGGANQTSDTFSNVGSGIYTITVTDANNCTISTSHSVLAPNTPNITNITTTPASCQPGNDAIITVTAANGTPNYQFDIGGALQANNIFNGVGIGTYTVTVTDAVGCTGTSVATIVNPPSPTISVNNTTTASCNPGCDGTVTLSASGGTNPVYSYAITGFGPQVNNVFNNLCTNSYIATVQDGNGCIDTTSFIITTAIGPSITNIITDSVNCFGDSNGSMNVFISGGTSPFNFNLLPNNLNNTSGVFNNLAQGNYLATVTDANGCTVNSNVTIYEPLPVQFDSVAGSGSLCNGSSNGGIFVSNSGGTGTFSYTINPNATFVPPGSFTNLLGNTTYSIVASDANGCTITTSVFISSPTALNITNTTFTNVTCNGDANGTAAVTIGGGTPAYSYNIMPGSITNASGNFSGLSGGLYTITITDANNCTVTTTVSIFEPPAIQINSFSSQNITCFGDNDGDIQVNAVGGVPSLTYNLQPSNQTNGVGSFNNLVPANYTITITDANNCTLTTSVLINEPALLTIDSFTTTNVSCSGLADGQIVVNNNGGNGGNNFVIQPLNISNTTGLFNTGITAQQYVISVTDSNGCSAIDSVIITEPNPLIANFTKTDILCSGANTGAINVTAVGGTPSYIFTLNPGAASNASGNFINLLAGTYSVTVTDVNNCSTILSGITITQPPAIQITSLSQIDVECYGDSTGEISLVAQGGTGTLQYSLSPNAGTQTTPGNFVNLYGTTYTVTVTDANNCTLTTSVFIKQNGEFIFDSLILSPPLCNGDDNGSIRFSISGGVGTLLYSINNSPFTTATEYLNLTDGTYQLTIIDSLNCQKDTNLILIEPDPIEFGPFDIRYATCNEGENGLAIIQAIGGVGNYTFYIRPGIAFNRTGVFPNLSKGAYTIRVADSNQCAIDSVFSITEDPNKMQSQIVKNDLPCLGVGNEGTAEIQITGGQSPYSYTWSTEPVQTNAQAINLRFGFYTVQVIDADGCEIKDSVFINPGDCCTEVFLPNSFSPNGDGRNDVFRILSTAGIELEQFEIFNRWGQKVWQTYTYYDFWDGTFKGEEAAASTYYYIYRYRCTTDNKEYIKKGDITIIR